MPTLSAHNLIVGTPYLDIGGTASATLMKPTEDGKWEGTTNCKVSFFRRGWFDKKDAFRMDGKFYEKKEQINAI